MGHLAIRSGAEVRFHKTSRILADLAGGGSMTSHIAGDPAIPDPEERAARNAALFADNIETGFWDDQGRVAPWPDDIDEWAPETNDPRTPNAGQPPF